MMLWPPVIWSARCQLLPSLSRFTSRFYQTGAEYHTDSSKSMFGSQEHIEPGPSKPSTWWMHLPRSGRKVLRMYPVRARHRWRIVLVREGCRNRIFFTIQVKSNLAECKTHGVEQLGSWDPYPNRDYGEQLIGLNVDRLIHWLGKGAEPSMKVAELLGLMGLYPIHPRSYLAAHRTRVAIEKRQVKTFPAGQPSESSKESDMMPVIEMTSANESVCPEQEGAIASTNEAEDSITLRDDAVFKRGKMEPDWWRFGLW